MAAYLVDSDWLIDLLDEKPEAINLLASLTAEGIAISAITYMEVFQGTLRNPSDARAARLEILVSATPVLPVDTAVAERCARIRESLLALGKRPMRRGLDLLIAATAHVHDLSLVTRNLDDYIDVPGIKLFRR